MKIKNKKKIQLTFFLKIYTVALLLVGSATLLAITSCASDGTTDKGMDSNQSNEEFQSNLLKDQEQEISNAAYESNTNWTNSLSEKDVSEETCGIESANLKCFISVWDTSIDTSSGDAKTIYLPLVPGKEFNFYVNWGDGSAINQVTNSLEESTSHTYTNDGVYTVHIAGTIEGWSFGVLPKSRERLTDITQWGSLVILNDPSDKGIFEGAENFVGTATDAPDVSKATSLASAFEGASNFNGVVNDWDVSQVTTMDSMFKNAEKFNQPVGGWVVSKVTNMDAMFNSAKAFDQNTKDWTLTSLTTADGFNLRSGLSLGNLHNWFSFN